MTPKSTSPAASNADSATPLDSPNAFAICAAIELAPASMMFGRISNSWLMMSKIAIVSPSARPSPSIAPPMIPPRPNGRTTDRIMPHRVPPWASAPSFSPGGTCEKTSRITAVQIGTTMSETTTPAVKADGP